MVSGCKAQPRKDVAYNRKRCYVCRLAESVEVNTHTVVLHNEVYRIPREVVKTDKTACGKQRGR